MPGSLFLATYFADIGNLETVHEPGQLITVERTQGPEVVASGARWNDGRRSFTTHMNTNLRTISTNSKTNPAKLVVSTAQPAFALDTTEMKALDDQATAGSNTEDFLELWRVTEVRAKRVPLRTLANLERRVSALPGEDVPAVTRQGAVCKFMQVLSCFACGKTISRAREEDSNQKWHVSSLGRKLLRLMRKFQQSSETATKCCGDEKCIECPYYESSFEASFD